MKVESLPVKGVIMILLTIVISLALMIYLGADISKNRIDKRSGLGVDQNVWWEKGFIVICPLH